MFALIKILRRSAVAIDQSAAPSKEKGKGQSEYEFGYLFVTFCSWKIFL
jgi:hypothetical protein